MNKDDKEAFAQKIAQQQDSGLTRDQKSLVTHIEQAIETNKSKPTTEIDYHRYWKDMYEKEHQLRLEAEGETHLVKAVGMNSPEMKEAKAKLKETELGLANSLEVNESHQKLNGKLQVRLTELEQENIELHADNKKLAQQVDDKVNQLRTKGLL
jgi:hypothetical protein